MTESNGKELLVLDFQQLFDSIAQKMRVDFDNVSSQVKHRGAKGRLRENAVVAYARQWLPATIDVAGPGELIAINGDTSRECDVLIFDARAPKLIDEDDYRVLPVECLYGVIQVKSQLDTSALDQDYVVIKTSKSLQKLAYEPSRSPIIQTSTVYGREWNYFPTWACVFAYQSISLDTLLVEVKLLDRETPVEHRCDVVVALDKGLIVNVTVDGQLSAWAQPLNHRVIVESGNPLLLLTLFMQEAISNAWMPNLQLRQYLRKINFGNIVAS